jgi:hypothetical protein
VSGLEDLHRRPLVGLRRGAFRLVQRSNQTSDHRPHPLIVQHHPFPAQQLGEFGHQQLESLYGFVVTEEPFDDL